MVEGVEDQPYNQGIKILQLLLAIIPSCHHWINHWGWSCKRLPSHSVNNEQGHTHGMWGVTAFMGGMGHAICNFQTLHCIVRVLDSLFSMQNRKQKCISSWLQSFYSVWGKDEDDLDIWPVVSRWSSMDSSMMLRRGAQRKHAVSFLLLNAITIF